MPTKMAGKMRKCSICGDYYDPHLQEQYCPHSYVAKRTRWEGQNEGSELISTANETLTLGQITTDTLTFYIGGGEWTINMTVPNDAAASFTKFMEDLLAIPGVADVFTKYGHMYSKK